MEMSSVLYRNGVWRSQRIGLVVLDSRIVA